jgi:hypothetical protein
VAERPWEFESPLSHDAVNSPHAAFAEWRQDRIHPSCVYTQMVGAFYRDELSGGNLVCRASRLIEEVDVVGRHADEAGRAPRFEVFTQCALVQASQAARIAAPSHARKAARTAAG